MGQHPPNTRTHDQKETNTKRAKPKGEGRIHYDEPSRGKPDDLGELAQPTHAERLRRPYLHGSISPYEEQAWVIFISNNLISPITVWRIMPRAGRKWKQQRALTLCLAAIEEGEPLRFYSAAELRDLIVQKGWRYDPPTIRELGSWLARDRHKRFISKKDFNGPKMYRSRYGIPSSYD